MIAATLAAAILISPAASFGQRRQRAATPLPEVKIDITRHDFGEVFISEDISHVFTVRNFGPAPLELSTTEQLLTPRATSAAYNNSAALRTRDSLSLQAAVWRWAAPG
jgi:hypothetical protein